MQFNYLKIPHFYRTYLRRIVTIMFLSFIISCGKHNDSQIRSMANIEHGISNMIKKISSIKKICNRRIRLIDIYYIPNYKIYDFREIKSKRHIYIVVDNNNNRTVANTETELFQTIKPSLLIWTKKLNSQLNTYESNNVYYFIIEAVGRLTNDHTFIINHMDDITGLDDSNKVKIEKVKIFPLTKSRVGDKIEIRFFTWDWSRLELIRNKITLSDDFSWSKKNIEWKEKNVIWWKNSKFSKNQKKY